MAFLSDSLGGFVAPEGIKNPRFRHTVAIGPAQAEEVCIRCLSRPKSSARVFDPDFDTVSKVTKDQAIRPDGDLVYFVFSEAERWILCYGNDLEIAVLFCENSPELILGMHVDPAEAEEDFFNSMLTRMNEKRDYYNTDTINNWISLTKI